MSTELTPLSTTALAPRLASFSKLIVKQRFEAAEMFGFESRNKYDILDESGAAIAYAAEQQKGFLGIVLRQFLGHWRTFDIHLFTADRQAFLVAHHPFRFFFQRIDVKDTQGKTIGAIQRRFSILTKRFDVLSPDGRVLFEVASPFWKMWTFPFQTGGRQRAIIRKKWAGLLTEAFTDKDTFMLEFEDPAVSESERLLLLAAALFIDIQFFENKADSR